MSEFATNNDCGVSCPRQLECVRAIGRYNALIERYESEAFKIEMSWREKHPYGELPEVIRLLKQDNGIRIEKQRSKIDETERELGRLVMLECDGPGVSVIGETGIALVCRGKEPESSSQ